MKKIQVQALLKSKDGPQLHSIPGYQSEVKGLAIHRTPVLKDGAAIVTVDWNVTHISTGLALPYGSLFPRRKDAVQWVEKVGELANWELETTEKIMRSVMDQAEVLRAMRQARDKVLYGEGG